MTAARVTLLLIVSASLLFAGQVIADRAGTPESDIGLSKSLANEIPTPEPTLPNTSDPGEEPVDGAPFEGGPPPVSHGVDDFLPITFERNDCVECHAVEEKLEGEATPIPPSHYTDLRHAPDEVSSELIGARYNCVSCHVSLGQNEPLVGNSFESD